jgi:1-aminocyclopropane-1-carboxylate deaminase/D-cysteine desulfhydrase-like pyridoxal-dependent ACC family enzyme
VDPRVKSKLINVMTNTPLEYGFHLVLYIEKEIKELDVKNKKLLKRMMNISIRCLSSLLKIEIKKVEYNKWWVARVIRVIQKDKIEAKIKIVNFVQCACICY